MLDYLKTYAAAFAGFIVLDFMWLAVIARKFYRNQLGFLLADQPNWWAALLFYLLFVAGLVVFVIVPSLHSGSLQRSLLLGAFFGLVTYATYDLTNHATIEKWPWIVTLVDLCWGALLSAAVSAIGYCGARWLSAF